MFIKNIFYKQIKIKTISALLGSIVTTTTIYVINIYAYIPGKKACRSKWLSHNNNIFVCARAMYIAYVLHFNAHFILKPSILFFEWKNNATWASNYIFFLKIYIYLYRVRHLDLRYFNIE